MADFLWCLWFGVKLPEVKKTTGDIMIILLGRTKDTTHNNFHLCKNLSLPAGLGLLILGVAGFLTGCGPQGDEDPGTEEVEETGALNTGGASDNLAGGDTGNGSTQTGGAAASNNPFAAVDSSSTNPSANVRAAAKRTASGNLDYVSARTWTDNQGRTMEAQLTEFTEDKVILRDRVGRSKTVPRSALSMDDNDWLDLVEMTALPSFEPAEDAPKFFKIIDTADGQVIWNASVKSYGNLGITVIHDGGTETHLPYNRLNKSHLRKIGYPVEALEPEAVAAADDNALENDS